MRRVLLAITGLIIAHGTALKRLSPAASGALNAFSRVAAGDTREGAEPREDPRVRRVVRESARVEAGGYCRWTPLAEICAFANNMASRPPALPAAPRFPPRPGPGAGYSRATASRWCPPPADADRHRIGRAVHFSIQMDRLHGPPDRGREPIGSPGMDSVLRPRRRAVAVAARSDTGGPG